jgi:hypothetical protein
MLRSFTAESIASYVSLRKAEGIGNRTVNIEVGVLRRILKQFKLWHFVGESYKPLPEPKDIGKALSPEQELRLFNVASSRGEWNVAFWVRSLQPTRRLAGAKSGTLDCRTFKRRRRRYASGLGRTGSGSGLFPSIKPLGGRSSDCSTGHTNWELQARNTT